MSGPLWVRLLGGLLLIGFTALAGCGTTKTIREEDRRSHHSTAPLPSFVPESAAAEEAEDIDVSPEATKLESTTESSVAGTTEPLETTDEIEQGFYQILANLYEVVSEFSDDPLVAVAAEPTERVSDELPVTEAAASSEPIRGNSLIAAAPAPVELISKELRFVKVFYGTNRARTEACVHQSDVSWDGVSQCTPNDFFGGEMSFGSGQGQLPSGLEVGTLTVTFPHDHEVGTIERPLRIIIFSLRDEDPEKDVVITELSSNGTDYAAWVNHIRSTGRDQAFIYVHGFANTFAYAARRTAQVAYDLDFDLDKDFAGLTMLFSWPSIGGFTDYGADSDSAEHSADAFNQFLDLIKVEAGISRVHVIAHSMGSQVVANALERRQLVGMPVNPTEPIIDQLVMAAPDIWADIFKNKFQRILPRFSNRVTLYVSDHDKALDLSRIDHSDKPRAGHVAGGILEESDAIDRFDGINASTVSTDLLGHSYHTGNRSVLSDMYCLFKGALPEHRPRIAPAAVAWEFLSPDAMPARHSGDCSSPILPDPKAKSRWLKRILLASAGFVILVFGILIARRRQRKAGVHQHKLVK